MTTELLTAFTASRGLLPGERRVSPSPAPHEKLPGLFKNTKFH